MAKNIDFITIRVTAFFILTAWTVYITDSLIWGIVLGIVLFVLFNVIYGYYSKKKRPYTYNQLAFYMATCDSPTDVIAKLIPEDISYIIEDNVIKTNTDELIYVSFGFSAFSMSDILKAIKSAKKHNKSIVTVITTEIDRSIYTIINRSTVKVNLINIKALMKLIIKKNIQLDINNQPKHLNSFSEIFNRTSAGRFFLCGSLIAVMSIVMPVKLYYLIMSGICFVLGILCIKNPKKKSENKSVLK